MDKQQSSKRFCPGPASGDTTEGQSSSPLPPSDNLSLCQLGQTPVSGHDDQIEDGLSQSKTKTLGPSPSTSNKSPDSATSVEGSDVTTIVPYNSIEGQIDLGVVVHAAQNSLDRLRHISEEMPDAQRMQYLSSHFRPSPADVLHSHTVTKQGRCWNAHFQLLWLDQFLWLSYSNELKGGICRYCILFPERPSRGGTPGGNRGNFVLLPYQKPYTKALGKNGFLTSHEKSAMHRYAAEKADIFAQNFRNPDTRVDNRLLKQQAEQEQQNKEILCQVVLAVEFLAKQGLPFRGNKDDKVDFADESVNRGNFIALLQLLGKFSNNLQNHLFLGKRNALYTSKTIQNEIIHIYACKIKERLTKHTREKNLPYSIITDEVTDPHANHDILSVCLRFVDLTSLKDPHIKECLIIFLNLERANASAISSKILESLSHPSVSLDPARIRGQGYDGATVMSSARAGVQAKIKEISPLAIYTHCFSHCLNLAIAASCKVQEVRNLIGLINEAYLFLANSPK